MSLRRVIRLRNQMPPVDPEPPPPPFLDECRHPMEVELWHQMMSLFLAKRKPRNLLNYPGGSVLLQTR